MANHEGAKPPEIPVSSRVVGSLMGSSVRILRRAVRPVSRGATGRAVELGQNIQDGIHEQTHDSDNGAVRLLGRVASGGTFLSFGRSRYTNRPPNRQNRP